MMPSCLLSKALKEIGCSSLSWGKIAVHTTRSAYMEADNSALGSILYHGQQERSLSSGHPAFVPA